MSRHFTVKTAKWSQLLDNRGEMTKKTAPDHFPKKTKELQVSGTLRYTIVKNTTGFWHVDAMVAAEEARSR